MNVEGRIELTDWFSLSDLTSPERWIETWFAAPDPLRDLEWPLDWILYIGGPVRRHLDRLLREWAASPPARGRTLKIRRLMPDDPLIRHERASWMDGQARHLEAVTCSIVPFGSLQDPYRSSSVFWGNFLLGPTVRPSRQKSVLESEIELYAKENSADPFAPPWIYWSRFPMWQNGRNRELGLDRELDHELDLGLTRIGVALSPHDEIAESLACERREVKLNPTLDIVQTRDQLVALYRGFTLGNVEVYHQENRHVASPLGTGARESLCIKTRILDAKDAAIIDCIRENFRMNRSDLEARVCDHTSEPGRGRSCDRDRGRVQELFDENILLGR